MRTQDSSDTLRDSAEKTYERTIYFSSIAPDCTPIAPKLQFDEDWIVPTADQTSFVYFLFFSLIRCVLITVHWIARLVVLKDFAVMDLDDSLPDQYIQGGLLGQGAFGEVSRNSGVVMDVRRLDLWWNPWYYRKQFHLLASSILMASAPSMLTLSIAKLVHGHTHP